jgi:DNA-entry nuclease
VKETNNHVLYRVTPIFEGNNLVATGVLIEAKSVEDNGRGILFNVYCYNNQPQITIDYATGDSALTATPTAPVEKPPEVQPPQPEVTPQPTEQPQGRTVYVAPQSGKKYHYDAHCRGLNNANSIASMTEQEAINGGYGLCGWED